MESRGEICDSDAHGQTLYPVGIMGSVEGRAGWIITAPPAGGGASNDPGLSWAATPFVMSRDVTCASPGVGHIANCSADASNCSHPLGELPPGGAGETCCRLHGGTGDRADALGSALGSTTPVSDPLSTARFKAHASHRGAGSECGQDCAGAVMRGSAPPHIGGMSGGSDSLSACSGSDQTVAGNPLGGAPSCRVSSPRQVPPTRTLPKTPTAQTQAGMGGGMAAPRVKA